MQESFIKPDCLNVFVSMPCPLKVPFKQIFDPFIEKWNSDSSRLPINIPDSAKCSPGGFEDSILEVTSEDELPDVYISSSYKILFSGSFHKRFLETGRFTGLPQELYSSSYPPNVIDAAEKYNVGFLAFSSWGVVHDTRYNGKYPLPERWEDLTKEQYKDLISIHGCHGQAGNISMLMNLEKAGGSGAIEALADNIKKAGHFSKLIKELGSNKDESTPFYIMPTVAIANIPTTKKAELVDVKENIISPLFVIVKKTKLEQALGLLKFFAGEEFKKLLSGHAYFQPEDVAGIESYSFEHMEIFLKESYRKVYDKLNRVFITALGEKIPAN